MFRKLKTSIWKEHYYSSELMIIKRSLDPDVLLGLKWIDAQSASICLRPFLSRKGICMALKKQWYEIIAPKMFEEKLVGETLAVEPKHLIGRILQISLIELVRDYSKFYIKLNLQVDRVEGNKAYTKLVGHDVMRERVYRLVQHHGRRVDVIQDLTTKDGVKVRVKTVFVLLKRVGTSMKDATRKAAKSRIEELVPKMTFEELMRSIISGELANEARKTASKAYPVASIEIRKTEVLHEKKKQQIEVEM